MRPADPDDATAAIRRTCSDPSTSAGGLFIAAVEVAAVTISPFEQWDQSESTDAMPSEARSTPLGHLLK